MVRKDLVLDDPRALAAYLTFNGREMDDNDHALHISINGHYLIRPPSKIAHPSARHYYTSDWGRLALRQLVRGGRASRCPAAGYQ